MIISEWTGNGNGNDGTGDEDEEDDGEGNASPLAMLVYASSAIHSSNDA